MEKKYESQTIAGTRGLFTFNFFCESIITALHTLLHMLEHAEIPAPEELSKVPKTLSDFGMALQEDYDQKAVNLCRIKEDILRFYKAAFKANDKLVPLLPTENNEIFYYYLLYTEGVNLLFANFMYSLCSDFPDNEDMTPAIAEIRQAFLAVSESYE